MAGEEKEIKAPVKKQAKTVNEELTVEQQLENALAANEELKAELEQANQTIELLSTAKPATNDGLSVTYGGKAYLVKSGVNVVTAQSFEFEGKALQVPAGQYKKNQIASDSALLAYLIETKSGCIIAQ